MSSTLLEIEYASLSIIQTSYNLSNQIDELFFYFLAMARHAAAYILPLCLLKVA